MQKIKKKILGILKEDGYIEDYRLLKNNTQGTIKIYLKYEEDQKPAIIGIKKISKSGLRVYVKSNEIPRVINGLGTSVISTSKGVLQGR